MQTDINLVNAKILTPSGIKSGGIALEGEKIFKLGKEPNLPKAITRIDVEGKLVLPGLIDCHVHLRDLELSYKETFFTGTCAAAAGGITTVHDMPNTKPLTNSYKSLREKKIKANKEIIVNVGFFCLFPDRLEEIDTIIKEEIIGFKIYPHCLNQKLDPFDFDAAREAFRRVALHKIPIAIHPDMPPNFSKKREASPKKRNISDIEEFLFLHGPEKEAEAINWFSKFLTATRSKLHICHVSTISAIKLILDLKSRDMPITCEVTPHHLILTKECLFEQRSLAKMLPPLRSNKDTRTLWSTLKNSKIDIVASDHAPHSLEEKLRNFHDAPSGIPGLETLLSVMFTQVLERRIPLQKFAKISAENPAKIFNLGKRGKIVEGYQADLVVIDTKKEIKINPDKFISKAKFSPFKGMRVRGIPDLTIVGGKIVFEKGKILGEKGTGQII